MKESKRLHILVTTEQMFRLKERYKMTTCRNFSDFIRSLLDQEPVVMRYRNQSIDEITPMITDIRNSLEAAELSYRRVIADLRSRVPTDDVSTTLATLMTNELAIREKIDELKTLIIKIYDRWSPL